MSGELKPLVEHLAPRKFEVIQEKAEGNNWMLVRGLIQRANQKNGNGRIYTRDVFETALRDPDVMKRLGNRGMTGVVEHPDSGQTHLMEVSHVVTKAWMEGDEVYGEMLVLDTVPGTHIQKLFRAGVPVGISSRGRGTSYMKDGTEYVEASGFKLDTWDFVSTPSVDGAYPRMAESLQGPYRTESSMDAKVAEMMRLHVRAHEIGNSISSADLRGLDKLATELVESESKINTLLSQKPELKAEAEKALKVVESSRAAVAAARDRLYTETAAPFAAKVQAVISPTVPTGTTASAGADLLAETFARLAIADKRIAEMSEKLKALEGAAPSGKFAAAKRLSVALLSAKKESDARLETMRGEVARISQEHASALKLLEALISRNDEAKLARRKREALEDNPALGRGRDFLDRCTTLAELDQTIEMLGKALSPKGKKESAPAKSKPATQKVACAGCSYVTEAEADAGEIVCPQCGKQKLAAISRPATDNMGESDLAKCKRCGTRATSAEQEKCAKCGWSCGQPEKPEKKGEGAPRPAFESALPTRKDKKDAKAEVKTEAVAPLDPEIDFLNRVLRRS